MEQEYTVQICVRGMEQPIIGEVTIDATSAQEAREWVQDNIFYQTKKA